jgi:hypothetical protein
MRITQEADSVQTGSGYCNESKHSGIDEGDGHVADMWRAWVGFNISHGGGALFFSLIYLYLSVAHLATLSGSIALLSGAPVVALIYLVLSIKYWFRVPVFGAALGLSCFVAAAAASLCA